MNAEREWQKAYQIAEKQRTESRSLEEERKIHEGQNADAFYERATNAALDKMPEEEQQRIREINKLVSPDRLRELGNGEHTNNTVGYDYIVVVASYLLDSRQSRVYLNSILDEFEDSKIYASRKRKLDYVYIDAGNNYESIMARMKQIREDTHFKNAWVHIVRLSELIGQ